MPIPGVLDSIARLRKAGVKIGSTTGYARKTLDKLAPAAAALGYALDVIVAGDEVENGRPGPGMMLACMQALGVTAEETVKVDDAAAGVAKGRAVGAYTFGLALTGTLAGLDKRQLFNLGGLEQQRLRDRAESILVPAGANRIIGSVAGLADILLREPAFHLKG